jgi:putative transposase
MDKEVIGAATRTPGRGGYSLAYHPEGNNRQACFYSKADYHRYLQDPGDQARKYGCRMHAYCLMTHHVHLLIRPERVESAGLMMKHLGQRYLQYVNLT